jgi:hypothetical protein
MKIKHLYIALILCCSLFSNAQNTANMLKAGFLQKFATFSEWPKQSMGNTFDIYVIGNIPFNKELDEIYANVNIKTLPVQIHYINSVLDLRSCEILFISSSERKQLSTILEYTKYKPILTISDHKDFAKLGVMINFYLTTENTLHFEINREPLNESGIIMDIILLEYAKIIK